MRLIKHKLDDIISSRMSFVVHPEWPLGKFCLFVCLLFFSVCRWWTRDAAAGKELLFTPSATCSRAADCALETAPTVRGPAAQSTRRPPFMATRLVARPAEHKGP